MLVARGLLTNRDLQHALAHQSRTGDQLGRILVARGLVHRLALGRTLADQWRLPFADLTEADVDPALPSSLDPQAMVSAGVFPMHDRDGTLHVATAMHPDQAVERIRSWFGEEAAATVDWWVTTDWDVSWAVQRYCRERLLTDAALGLYRRSPDASARTVITGRQKVAVVIGLLTLATFLVRWNLATREVLGLLVNGLFLLSVAYKFATSLLGGFGHPGTHVTTEEAAALPEGELPRFTILVPAYREEKVVGQLIANLGRLDYPPDKLEILLLLEEDDQETIAAAKAARPGATVRFVVIPDGLPKTKPKACNVGLAMATGELLVIYDAEDRPDPDQLRKVVVAFRRGDEQVICVQARLTYFNAHENALTRLFTLEYDAWFQLMLPVLDRFRLPIPLGGTSNHFRTAALRRLGGWDPYNVTEDADLGIRASARGYRVSVVNSDTLEEANNAYGNWIRQRSRWIKGYMQTSLVHTRHPWRLVRAAGLRSALGLAFLVAGTPLTFLLAPVLWLDSTQWYLTHTEVLLPDGGGVAGHDLALVNLAVGNVLAVISSAAASAKRRQWALMPWALLNPLYWVLHSISAYKAAWQLITKPFYWEKTVHGLTTAAPLAAAAEPEASPGPSG